MEKQSDVYVSVICLAYNHEKFIRDALEGFVNQKTLFRYEVFVHDDCSQDGTTDIIREYEKKYPDIVKGIYQKTNQCSKGKSITRDIVYPLTRGKYIALCEGDDYWIDNNKLQKQVDFLDSHPDYSAVTHNTYRINCKTGKTTLMYDDCDKNLGIIDVLGQGGNCFHTSSTMCRREFYYYPKEFDLNIISDYPLSIYLAIKGKIYFLRDCMSVYRYLHPGSWSNTLDNTDVQLLTLNRVVDMLKAVDEYTEGKYHDDIEKVILVKREYIAKILMGRKQFNTVREEYSDVTRNWSVLQWIKQYIKGFLS